MIFIVTDGPHSPVAKLFPKQLVTSLDIHNIRYTSRGLMILYSYQLLYLSCCSFNPVAPTALMKLAQSVMKAEYVGSESGHGRFVTPDKSVVEALVAGSNGDVRSLLNSLQFACLKGDVMIVKYPLNLLMVLFTCRLFSNWWEIGS